MRRILSILPFALLGTGCLVDAQIQVDTGLTASGTTGDDCPAGSWGCECTDLQLCQAGLACQNGVCVDPGDIFCGNGIIEAGEECDDGPESPMCDADCTWAVCGDWYFNPQAGEECDQGPMGGPECSPQCTWTSFEPEDHPMVCQDGIDNDGDGFVDCQDFDCINSGSCPAEPEDHPAVCSDGLDNDQDGFVDCEDFDCINSGSCPAEPEDHPIVCTDGLDNDQDGFVDCQDFDCQTLPECAGTEDCFDGVDNDGDGFVDCDDFDCAGVAGCQMEPEDHPAVCTDGIDNDADGFVDCDDIDCQSTGVCEFCGDGTQNPGEACDGADLAGQTCATQGFTGGTLACAPDCTSFDTSGCF